MNLRSVPWVTLVAFLFLAPAVGASHAQGTAVPDAQRLVAVADPSVRDPTHFEGPPSPTLPLPPTSLWAHIDGAAVELEWDAPLHGQPTAYRIYRADAPNGGWPDLRSGLDAAWQPLHEVPGNTTTFRDTGVNLARQHYVYVVTALHDAPKLPVGGPAIDARQDHGSESPPSNPAYTANTFTSCQWYDLNMPHMSAPPTVHPECIHPALSLEPVLLFVTLESR